MTEQPTPEDRAADLEREEAPPAELGARRYRPTWWRRLATILRRPKP